MIHMRYAVYYAPPPEHPLWQAGCDWLGRDPGAPDGPGSVAGMPRRPDVVEPWRYGFHATLKPPMRLRPGHKERDFMDAVQRLARRTACFMLPRLTITTLGDFVALRTTWPLSPSHPLRYLADACVSELDAFRAPPTLVEVAKRLAQPLDGEQRALLARWGYPHVFHRWRFHLTLSNSLTLTKRRALLGVARAHFSTALHQPAPAQDLSVYVEPAPGAPFVLAERFALQGAGRAVGVSPAVR
jgi:hypothetical protein